MNTVVPFTDDCLSALKKAVFDAGRSGEARLDDLMVLIESTMLDGEHQKSREIATLVRNSLPPVPTRVLAALRRVGCSESAARRIVRSYRDFGGEKRAICNAFKHRHNPAYRDTDIDTSDIPEQDEVFFANAKRTRLTPSSLPSDHTDDEMPFAEDTVPANARAAIIAEQNDRFRAALGSTGEINGHLAATKSVAD